MHATPRRALPRAALLLVVVLPLVTSTTACNRVVPWRLGKTHGIIIEHSAVRASLGIYRVPTRALREVHKAAGTKAVQEVLWAKGRPPELKGSIKIAGKKYSLRFSALTKILRSYVHHLIYERSSDLSSALEDTRSHDDCLALTLLSAGLPDENWTHKRVGCVDGAIR
jgi:hypothetical protein